MGVQISGDTGNVLATKGTYTGNLTVGGVLTYEDVTNVDSVGLVTARSGIEIGARPGVGASISVDGNAIFSGITTATTIKSTTGIVTTLTSTTFNVDGGDATFKGASANITFDQSLDDLIFDDNAQAKFGGGGDLALYHLSSDNNSYIKETGSGSLMIQGDIVNIGSPTSGEYYIRAFEDGAVHLRYDNTTRLQTTSSGVSVTGNCNVDGNVTLSDNEEVQLGNSTDFRIYHDGSHSYIRDVGTGQLRIQSDVFSVENAAGTENILQGSQDGAVSLYHNNVVRLSTFTEGLSVHVAGNSGLRIIGTTADVNPRLVFRRKNNDGNNSEPAAIEMSYLAGTTHESGHLDFFTNGDSGSAALARRVRIRNDGQVLINTTTLTSLGSQTGYDNVVTVNKSGIVLTAYSVVAGFYYDRINYTNSQYYIVNNSGTGVYLGNGSTSWSANSDERLKINIAELDGTKAYNHVKTARATSFNWNATGHPTDKKI